MLPKDILMPIIFFLTLSLVPGEGFLLPILFPVSIKITIHSNRHKPAPKPKPDYHFSSIPVYKEVVVKGSPDFGEVGGYKQSYGDGHKYGTSYGDGHLKVYTEEPHVKKGYGTGYAELSVTSGHHKGTDYHSVKGSAYFPAPETHYKGTPYEDQHIKGGHYTQAPETHYEVEAPQGHYKGTNYETPQPGHYKGTEYQAQQPEGHYKGTEYQAQQPDHYKGTEYQAQQPEGHYKGTVYQKHQPAGHHKGTTYDAHQPEGHYKGTTYEEPAGHYKGTDYRLPEEQSSGYGYRKKKVFPKNHSFIKAVQGYKITDYLPNHVQQQTYQENDKGYVSHVAIPPKVEPGHSYAEIAAAHKVKHTPKAYEAKEYADLGTHQYKPQQDYVNQSPDYLDDSLPAYKYPPTRYTERSGLVDPTDPTMYAGYGTTFYGDSYGKIVYEPKNLRISIRTYKRH